MKRIVNEIQVQIEIRIILSTSTIYQINKCLKNNRFINEIKKVGKQEYIHIIDYGLEVLYNEKNEENII